MARLGQRHRRHGFRLTGWIVPVDDLLQYLGVKSSAFIPVERLCISSPMRMLGKGLRKHPCLAGH